jgi:hypothetical protein
MENLSVHLEYKDIKCEEFTKSGKKETVSVTIIPLRIVQDEKDEVVKISTGCSMWKGCENGNCSFSSKSYGPRK